MKKSTKHLFSTLLYFLGIIVVMFLLYFVITMPHAEAETKKFGDGPFVMAISFTDYNNLQYVGNFPTCKDAERYYYANCTDAPVMMCQRESAMHIPINRKADNKSSTFDFEINEAQSCGFVGVDTFKSSFTGVEE